MKYKKHKNSIDMFTGYFRKIKKLFAGILNSRINIVGINLKDASIDGVLLDVDYKKLKEFSQLLPNGVVSDGKIINKNEFVQALKIFRSKIGSKKKKISTIISISDENIYTQVINLPYIEGKSEKGAILLNIEMVSPMDLNKSYNDWQYFEKKNNKFDKRKIIASFIDKSIIDGILETFNEAGFLVVAIEQRAMSLSRVIKKYVFDNRSDYSGPAIVLDIDSDGLSFSINSDGNLVFNRFVKWKEIYFKNNMKISFNEFKDIVIEESHKIINYYVNKFEEEPKFMLVISSGIGEKLKPALQEEFKIMMPSIDIKGYKLSSFGMLAAFGAAIRGTKRRSEDLNISLTPINVKEEFFEERVISFMTIWRDVISVVFVVILLMMLGEFILLGDVIKKTNSRLSKMYSAQSSIKLLDELKVEAKRFNKNISLAKDVYSGRENYNKLINDVYNIALSKNVEIRRFYTSSKNKSITVIAHVDNEEMAVNFKNELKSIKGISKVIMPLENISQDLGGGVLFTLRFNYK